MKWRYVILVVAVVVVPILVFASVAWWWRAHSRQVEVDGYRDATRQATETAMYILHDLSEEVRGRKAGESLSDVLASSESTRIPGNYVVQAEDRALFRAAGQSVWSGPGGLPTTYLVLGCFTGTLVGESELRVAEAECDESLVPTEAPPRVLHPPWFAFDPVS